MAHFFDAAQPTHPISSTEDADMQPNPAIPRPDAHDIATPRRSIGGRCRKWVVSTQDPALSNKRTCAALYDRPIFIQQTHMRCVHEVQQTVYSRRTKTYNNGVVEMHNDHTYMPNASKAASRPATSSSPKNSTDTEARDAVMRLRDSVLSAAENAEVVPSYLRPTRRQLHGGP